MARRKTRASVVDSVAPNDGTKWGHLSDAELLKETARELARRRAARGTFTSLDDIESFIEVDQRDAAQEELAAVIDGLPPEGVTSKPCPKRCAGAGEGPQPLAPLDDDGR